MVVAPVRYTASFITSMKTGGPTAIFVLLVMMREDGNVSKTRYAISSAVILDSECSVTAGQYSFLFMNVAWMKSLTLLVTRSLILRRTEEASLCGEDIVL